MRKRGKPLLASAIALTAIAVPAAGQSSWTPQEQAEYQARVALTESGKLLHNEVPSADTFKLAQSLGLRSDGVYWHNDIGTLDQESRRRLGRLGPVYTDYIRFCEDGSVVSAVTSGTPRDVAKWLSCEPVNPRYSHGTIKLDGKAIRFSLYMTTGVIDYWGTLERDPDSGAADLDLSVRTNIKFAESYGTTDRETFAFHRW